jgi:molecular chaperone HtpG
MPGYSISIPTPFTDKLKGTKPARLVEEVLEAFSDFVGVNNVVFFRQYTDHGPKHIEAVLETAAALMTPESHELMTAEDVCVLVIATVLHDAALHLQEPGFLSLVSGLGTNPMIRELDESNWNVLWDKYVSETSRLSQTDLEDIFGVSEPVRAPVLTDPNSWTPLQFAFIGEFIRRHHHRLAHEMAIAGIPGAPELSHFPPKLQADPLRPLVELSGLVARSHGMSIRPLLPYLERHYHKRRFQGTHTVYLMVLLRIADYLQLQADRASSKIFKVKRILSPISQLEWKVHEVIKDILYDQSDDPETVEVIVDPARTSIAIFLRIQDWLQGIQTELDTSWAVLGEVFGRFPERELGISIRRIRSNIDDVKTFGRDAGFVPSRVSFSAADAELLKLLIRPLYGERPEIAVRELVQNAVDAVRERKALGVAPDTSRSADVEVQVRKHDEGQWSLIVDDSGVGMTFETLAKFFLNAGASFRSSLVWKTQFQNESGKSTVLRSGRFGVGALAAFLLAEDPRMVRLKLTTRHIHSAPEEGLEFEAELTDRPISIRHVNKESPGTRIEVITSSAPAFMQRSSSKEKNLAETWDWYCLDYPVVRRSNTTGKYLLQAITLPSQVESSPESHHWVFPSDYEAVSWTFDRAPALVCNGIIISKDGNGIPPLEESAESASKLSLKMPSLSIFDRDGRLALTLDRLRVDFERLSFLEELREDVKRNIAAYLAVCAPADLRKPRSFDVTASKDLQTHPAIAAALEAIPWVLTPKGVAIFDPDLLANLEVESVVEVRSSGDIKRVKAAAKHDQLGIAITRKSLWESVQQKKLPAVRGAKRGIMKRSRRREDERNLERALHLLRTPDAYLEDPESYSSRGRGAQGRFLNRFGFLYEKATRQINTDSFYNEFRSRLEAFPSRASGKVLSTLDNTLSRSRGHVTNGMQRALLDLDSYEFEDETLSDFVVHLVLTLERDQRRIRGGPAEMDEGEAEYRFRRAVDRLQEEGPLDDGMLNDVLDRLHRWIHTGPRVLPGATAALEIVESFSNQHSLQVEGQVANSILDWDLLSGKKLGSDWSIVELSIDHTKVQPITSILGQIWWEKIQCKVLPYELSARKQTLAHLWDSPDMRRHLAQWESRLAASRRCENPKA